jgi:hypothetical protein
MSELKLRPPEKRFFSAVCEVVPSHNVLQMLRMMDAHESRGHRPTQDPRSQTRAWGTPDL